MKTNGKINLERFENKFDRNSLTSIINSFPINLEVHMGDEIDIATYDGGRSTCQGYFHISLIPSGPDVRCMDLEKLDLNRYSVSFYATKDSGECQIRDKQERYQLNIRSCR